MIREVHDGDAIVDYTYDAKGNKIKAVLTGDGETFSMDYTCDANGNIIKTITSYGDEVVMTTEASYNLVYIPIDISGEVEELFEELSVENVFSGF